MTDSSDQVAAFSSRGNVGIGIEGEFGRFKPDVVAPGHLRRFDQSGAVGHQRLLQSDQPHLLRLPRHAVVATNELYLDSIFVPGQRRPAQPDACVPNTNSPVPFPDLPIYVKQSGYPTNAPTL